MWLFFDLRPRQQSHKIQLSLERMKVPNYKLHCLTILALGLTGNIFAQGPPPPPPDGSLPIDQQLHYLLLAGLAIGFFWAYKQIKSQRSRD